MLISHERRFLFVHIQKTAGSSLRRALQESLPDLQPFLGAHDTALQASRHLGEERFRRYFKAAFVRNPWDRLVSWYSMIVDRAARRPWWWKALGRHEYRLWKYVHENSRSFEEFVLRCTAETDDRGRLKSFCWNQVDYISDERGRPLVDFVGRFETLSADAARLFDELGTPGTALPHVNPSRHLHYSAYYSDGLAEVVARRYARDVEAFGYRFVRREPPSAVRTRVGR